MSKCSLSKGGYCGGGLRGWCCVFYGVFGGGRNRLKKAFFRCKIGKKNRV